MIRRENEASRSDSTSRCGIRDHKRPVTRRDFLAQGFLTGAATVVAPAILGLLLNPRVARATLLAGPQSLLGVCNITGGAGKIPFICFDLAGGANIAGSNVLVGKQGGQLDLPDDRRLLEARPAGQHDARELDDQFHRHAARPGVPHRQRVPARHADAASAADHGASINGAVIRGPLRERHRQQPAQPDVRHRARPAPTASC